MKRLIDCFTFNNEFDMLELRLKEISSVVDKFILVEANSTFKGDYKPFYFDENKEKYKEWEDKIIHIKCIIPESITDVWSRERYQRNSFMTSLYYLGLSDNDLVMITDVDEIPNVDTIGYIKNGYPHDMKGLYKLEMDVYCASLYNKCTHIKWYHPKIVDWETLKSKTPDSCRLDFNCQWWENGGWHLTYFGGVDKIVNKIDSFSHQELNLPEFKVAERIIQKVRDGEDMFDLNSTTELINPYDNKNLPKNWKVLEKFEISYRNHKERKNLVLCNLNESNNESIISFVNSFREFNNEDDVYLITDSLSRYNSLSSLLHGRNINFIYSSFSSLINSNVYRFYKYLDFITENDSYNMIMLINTDDYIFSDNPFDIKADDEFIIFSEESENILIKNNTTSSDLFSLTFGEDLQDKIGNYQGLSSDIVIGSYKNIVNYLVKMTEIISNRIIINPEIAHERIDNSVNNFVARLDSDDLKNKEFKKLEIDIETNTNNPVITEKDLVICAAIGLDTDSIKNFIKSFRKHNNDADIFCIIESESSINKINFLKSNGVKLLFSDSIKFTRTQPNNTRFMKIADFLKETDKKYRNVLLSDIVDVVFQSDPFLNLTGEFIISPEEDEEKTIEKDQRFNARWLKQCFGDNLYEELKHNKILCCGTVIGSINNMKVYVDSICNEMFKLYENGSGHFQDMMDQGIHNYLFYKTPEIFKNPIIKRNGDYIATVGITVIEHPHKVEYLEDKIKVNGLIPSIVHQYNRSNIMVDFYNNLIGELKESVINYKGFNICVLKNDGIGKSASEGKIWENHIYKFLENNLDPEGSFIDIGSNYGLHAITASSFCKKVYSFEPQSLMFDLQKKSIELSDIKNINLYNLGLGNEPKTMNMAPIDYLREGINIGDLSLGEGGEIVEVEKLDNLKIPEKISIIKIDVQGFEKFVIEGSEDKLLRDRPILIVEFEEFQLRKFGYGCKELFDYIRSLNYEIYLLESEYPSDHVCVPTEDVDKFEIHNLIDTNKETNLLNYNKENGVNKKIIINYD